ncbi:sugar phosphate isomerase/epimerase family protein [Luteolibacter algae]|uniref:Sugar phosphate isomerase/epimerase family protein n=1 Tax=Luteolibacter algae TaxID=454151 RepID=A0ABW5D515_9BACT
MNRRSFLGTTTLTGLGLSVSGLLADESAQEEKTARQIAVFTKYFEHLDYADLAEKIAPLGVSGLEAPLRKKGHIEPEEMTKELPAFNAALAKKNLEVIIMASSINAVDARGLAEEQLRLAARLGIKRYRLEHLKYDLSKPLAPQIANFKSQLSDLAALNKACGIQGLYQNHRGNNFVGAPIWDMVDILSDIDPAHLGMAFDFAHAAVEGSNAWEINFRRALPHIGAVFFKDYKVTGKKWSACPLGEGMVNPKAGKLVSRMLPTNIPASIHIEYISGEDVVDRSVEAMRHDFATLQKWLG